MPGVYFFSILPVVRRKHVGPNGQATWTYGVKLYVADACTLVCQPDIFSFNIITIGYFNKEKDMSFLVIPQSPNV